jgi:hypothetical protein
MVRCLLQRGRSHPRSRRQPSAILVFARAEGVHQRRLADSPREGLLTPRKRPKS